jgi:hypothetical protein
MIKKHKKAISSIISILLLMAFMIIIVIGFQVNLNDLFSSIESDLEVKIIENEVEISKIENSILFLENNFKNNLNISYILINSVKCDKSQILISGNNTINISSCLMGYNSLDLVEIVLISNEGSIAQNEILR